MRDMKKIYAKKKKRKQTKRFVRKKFCRFCKEKVKYIDFKNPDRFKKFITERGKMVPSRVTGNCAKHQRMVSSAIKRARIIALLPFVDK